MVRQAKPCFSKLLKADHVDRAANSGPGLVRSSINKDGPEKDSDEALGGRGVDSALSKKGESFRVASAVPALACRRHPINLD